MGGEERGGRGEGVLVVVQLSIHSPAPGSKSAADSVTWDHAAGGRVPFSRPPLPIRLLSSQYFCATIACMEPLEPTDLKEHPVSFRMPKWLIDLINDLCVRLAHKHPLGKPLSRVEFLALAVKDYAKKVPRAAGSPSPEGQEPLPPIVSLSAGFDIGDVVWSTSDQKNPARRRYRVSSVKMQENGRNPKLTGWKLDARGEAFGAVAKLPPGRYAKAPEGKVEGVEEEFEGPRFYVKYGRTTTGVGLGWGVFERFDAKDEIIRGPWYQDEETANRAVPFVVRGIHRPKLDNLE